MSLPENDVVRLLHMLDAGEQALLFCDGRSRADLDGDVMLRFALVHAITVVGEAAAKISTPTRDALPDIAWGSIVGMRNRLVHAYSTSIRTCCGRRLTRRCRRSPRSFALRFAPLRPRVNPQRSRRRPA